MSSTEVALLATQAELYIEHLSLEHVVTVVTLTVLVYDLLLTFDREYLYVWHSRWTPTKAIFLANRYYCPILFAYDLCSRFDFMMGGGIRWLSLRPPPKCEAFESLSVPSTLPTLVIVSTILLLRTWAIYNRRTSVLIALIVTYLFCAVPAIVYFFVQTRGQWYSPEAIQTTENIQLVRNAFGNSNQHTPWILETCIQTGVPKALGAITLAHLIYETGLVVATIGHMIHHGSVTTPVRNFYMDGVAYYLLMFVILAAATFGSYYSQASRFLIASRYFIGLQALLGSRMILRLRQDFGPSVDTLRPTFHDQLGSRITVNEWRISPSNGSDFDRLDAVSSLRMHPVDVALTRNNSKSSLDRWIPLRSLSTSQNS